MSFLQIRNVSMRFGGLMAVSDASFDVAEGSITGLIGPNGAGKTTLFAIVSGFQKPTSGQVLWRGAEITARPPHVLAAEGLSRTFQIVQPFAGLSVRENIAVGAFLRHRRRADAIALAEQVAEQVGLTAELDKPAAALTVSGRKRVELGKALATQPKLLLLDEVLAGLNPSEVRDIVPVVRAIRDSGVTVLMIEHVMQAVMNLCESVHVLAQGRIIASGTPAEVVATPAVVEAYLGHGAASRLSGGAHA
ncbi:ABC transporter ATP-binding protein [Roseomonas frigidaquae]|uniref:ABC transporter ATP-binding protein n=1 Tax=Falsiroseomonas frigidaquae TaxID=487318 RepID=A0ABX1F662_9PROT|nr:ABC transporter ATP-binding protein [Falsiroseomonas frigidaquae]NKE47855.1 ABC transporter ATP-binding protein [Falsiroseomonas frigidaquae]